MFKSLIYILGKKDNEGDRLWKIQKSPIHGKGVFANTFIRRGTKIFLALDEDEVDKDGSTYIEKHRGRAIIYPAQYINHCVSAANTFLYRENSKYYVTALYDIYPNQELLTDYNNAPYFIKRPTRDFKDC